MPAYRRKRRTYRKKPYSGTKLMKKVAKQVITKTLETKHTAGEINSFINTSSSTGTYLVSRYMSNGALDSQLTGNKISLKYLQFKLMVRVPPSAGAQWTTQARILLVSCDQEIAWDTNVPTDFFLQAASGYSITAKVNPKKYSVLMDRTFQLSPQMDTTDGYNRIVSVTKTFKRGLSMEFNDTCSYNTQNYCKGKNYYFVVQAGGWANTLSDIQYRGSLYVKFKDV